MVVHRSAKENMQPCKTRNETVQKSHQSAITSSAEAELLRRKAYFEYRIAHTSADPVGDWSEYAKWALQHRPHERVSVLARAVKALEMDKRWYDDVRFLKLWIRLADEQKKVDTYLFFGDLEKQGIGTKHSLLYLAWASALESKQLYDQVDTVCRRGIHCCAEPVDKLQAYYAKFLGRVKRLLSQQAAAKEGDHAPSAADLPSTRLAVQSLQKTSAHVHYQSSKAPALWQDGGSSPSVPPKALISREAQHPLQDPMQSALSTMSHVQSIHRTVEPASNDVSASTKVSRPVPPAINTSSLWCSRKVPAGRFIDGPLKEAAESIGFADRPSKRCRIGGTPDVFSQQPAKLDSPLAIAAPLHNASAWQKEVAGLSKDLLHQRGADTHMWQTAAKADKPVERSIETETSSRWKIGCWFSLGKR